jgi:hypothetical protein
LSIRKILPNGLFERISTAEIVSRWEENERILGIRQHSGLANKTPPDSAKRTLDAYLARCRDGRLPARWGDCEPQQPVEATLELLCGYDWREPGYIEKVISLWAPCLPRRFRGITPEMMAETALQNSCDQK